MRTTIGVFGHPEGKSWNDIQQAVKTANGLQTQCLFELREERTLSRNSKILKLKKLKKQIALLKPKPRGLFFCEGPFNDGILINEVLPDRIYVSCKVPKRVKAPPLKLYLLYQMAAAALTLSAKLSNRTNRDMVHDPPVGCLWDWWQDAAQCSAAMLTARICLDCRKALHDHGNLSEEFIFACQQILDYIRRRMMGESPEIANCVFIAYGHGNDWQTLKDLLNSWGLEVEYFNRNSVAGLLVAERWRQMLNRVRFAFAVMTPDDELKDGKWLARQNVVHEIGLCHVRIGLQCTAILLAEGTQTFSNVDGVNYIPFKMGRLADQQGEIRKLLEDRGIL